MLRLQQRRKRSLVSVVVVIIAIGALGTGLYLLSLVFAPTLAPLLGAKPPIDATTLPAPKSAENRIVIPKIGVNIHYAPGEASLDRGAQWRYPERGNPATGGNFVLAAHRLSIQPTPQGTVEKSPFYRIDQLAINDQVLIDYNGKRYLYEITRIFDAKPTQTEIEGPSDTAVLTLYTCTLSGASDGRVVLLATPRGEVKT